MILISTGQSYRQACHWLARSGEHGIAQRQRDRRYPCLTDPTQRCAAVRDYYFDLGRFMEREQAIGIEILLLHSAVLERDLGVDADAAGVFRPGELQFPWRRTQSKVYVEAQGCSA
jgi:hypothetical protein